MGDSMNPLGYFMERELITFRTEVQKKMVIFGYVLEIAEQLTDILYFVSEIPNDDQWIEIRITKRNVLSCLENVDAKSNGFGEEPFGREFEKIQSQAIDMDWENFENIAKLKESTIEFILDFEDELVL